MRPSDVDGLGVGPLWVSGVCDTDGGHVHGRTQVNDVTNPGLTGININVVKGGAKSFFLEKNTKNSNGLVFKLINPCGLMLLSRHEVFGDVERSEVSPFALVHIDEKVGHQGVIGD